MLTPCVTPKPIFGTEITQMYSRFGLANVLATAAKIIHLVETTKAQVSCCLNRLHPSVSETEYSRFNRLELSRVLQPCISMPTVYEPCEA